MIQLPSIGTPIRYYSKQGVVAEHDEAGRRVFLKMDVDADGNRVDEWAEESDIPAIHQLTYGTIDDYAMITAPGEPIRYSPFGYVIGPDATVYSLIQRAYHGVVLALLFPEVAERMGYRMPDREPDTSHYTRFQIDATDLPAVRITFGFIRAVGVSKGYAPATAEQIESTRLALLCNGVRPQDKISCSFTDMKLRDSLDWLAQDHTPEFFDPETTVLVAPEPEDDGLGGLVV
ncbi:hypothetical protein [Geopseudomonas aromaticivorans]